MPTIKVHNYKSREEAINIVSNLDLSKVHDVKVTCKRGKRSIDQNRLMWMWLTCIEQETGQDKDEVHDFFKNKYLGNVKCLMFGETFDKRITTTRLDTAQFKQYLDKIQIFASTELGIRLPDPSDLEFERFKDYYSKFI
jgi:hypothetical protein